MTQEIAERGSGQQVVAAQGGQQLGTLAPSTNVQQFAADVRAAVEVGMALGDTPFIPTSYRKRGDRWLERDAVAATAAAAMLAGQEVGLSPIQSWQAIDVIEGRPSLNALAQRALVQAHGHEVWIEDRTSDAPGQRADVRVTVRGRRKGSDRIAESTWSLDRARQAGLLSKKNWERHPEAMCFARASSEVCRQIAADVLMGLAYTTEELQDEDGMDGAGDHTVSVNVGQQQPEEVGKPEEQPASEPEPATQPTGPTEEPERGEPGETPEDQQREQPDSLPVETAPAEPVCGNDPGDGRSCDREPGHKGRHHYPKDGEAPQGSTDGSGPTEEPDGRCQEAHPEFGRCVLDDGHEGAHEPEQEPDGGEEEGDLFSQPSDEELEAALEADRQAAAEAERVAAAAREAEPSEPVVEDPPAATPAAPADPPAGGDDDPWADFR